MKVVAHPQQQVHYPQHFLVNGVFQLILLKPIH